MVSPVINGYRVDRTTLYGNFQVFAKILKSEEMSGYFFDMESSLYSNRKEFCRAMRVADEAFAFRAFEMLYSKPEDGNLSDEMKSAMEEARDEEPSGIADSLEAPFKIFYVLHSCKDENLPYFEKALIWYCEWRNAYSARSLRRDKLMSKHVLRKMIPDLYGRLSDLSHPNFSLPSAEECAILYHLFYNFLWGFCRVNFPEEADYEKLQLQDFVIPLGKYLPLYPSELKRIGSDPVRNKNICILAEQKEARFFLTSKVSKEKKKMDREVDVLQNIWAIDNDSDRNNIITYRETLDLDEKHAVMIFQLPSVPLPLTLELLSQLNQKERLKLVKDSFNAIRALHENNPTYYHRDITPEVFSVCKVRSGYKLFLNTFECVKVTDPGYVGTVSDRVGNNRKDEDKLPYIAPEIIDLKVHSDQWKNVDWMAVDIYALGKLGAFILTGKPDLVALEQQEDLDEDWKLKLLMMCEPLESRAKEF